MTPSSHLDDDGLSAVLDGLGDPNEAEHARDCVECQDRLAQLDAARRLVAAPVPPPPDEVRRAAVAAAMAAAPDRTAPVPLRRRVRLAQTITGIAAALVVAGVAYAVVHDHHGTAKATANASAGTNRPTSTGISGSNQGAAGVGASTGAAQAAGSSGSGTAAVPGTSGLGPFTAPQPLVAALRQQLGSAAALHQSAPSALTACSGPAAAAAGNPRIGPILIEGLTYTNVPAEVDVYPRPGGDVAVVVRASDCHVLTTADF